MFFKCYCISSDFSDLPDMRDEKIDLSVLSRTCFSLNLLYLAYAQRCHA